MLPANDALRLREGAKLSHAFPGHKSRSVPLGHLCQDDVRLVSYWIGKEHWGKGVATRALAAFLHIVTERPLHARVAKHNVASIRVLEKCGFSLEREESGEVTDKDVVELVLVLR